MWDVVWLRLGHHTTGLHPGRSRFAFDQFHMLLSLNRELIFEVSVSCEMTLKMTEFTSIKFSKV